MACLVSGPGPGALSRVLHQRYPNMTAIEVDQRAVAFLAKKIPGLHVINMVGPLTVDGRHVCMYVYMYLCGQGIFLLVQECIEDLKCMYATLCSLPA